jgi:glycerol-3-phosphate acyltransferase PlsY
MIVICIIAAYIVGSIPTGYLITLAVKGIDIRQHGSGNPGATNVFRVAGPVPGAITFIIDFLKGFVPVILAVRYFGSAFEIYWILIGLAALSGHMWTIFLGFKGGKGVATGAGVFFALLPVPTAAAFVMFWIVFFITRYVSVASITAAILLPVFSFLTHKPLSISVFAACAAVLIIFRHRSNISKLFNGTESGFNRGKNG